MNFTCEQWAETRVLALRGLARVVKVCTRFLLLEDWFHLAWVDSQSMCQGAVLAATDNQEVAIAALGVIFAMLHITMQIDSSANNWTAAASSLETKDRRLRGSGNESIREQRIKDGRNTTTGAKKGSITSNKPTSGGSATIGRTGDGSMVMEDFERVETAKQSLWKSTWTAIYDASFFPSPCLPLALSFCNHLSDLYQSRADKEFRYSDNVRVLLEILVQVARPRGDIASNSSLSSSSSVSVKGVPSSSSSSVRNVSHEDRVTEAQLQRAVMQLLRSITPSDSISSSFLLSA